MLFLFTKLEKIRSGMILLSTLVRTVASSETHLLGQLQRYHYVRIPSVDRVWQ